MTEKKKAPIQKNDYIDVVFEDLTDEGSGVAKVEGYPIFVPFSLPEKKPVLK